MFENSEENKIRIWNNGQGIPVEVHREHKLLVPTMIFGHLLTSSNYDDTEKKTVGGRNGYGAKLCNIFSTRFEVETSCKKYRKKFKQVSYFCFRLSLYCSLFTILLTQVEHRSLVEENSNVNVQQVWTKNMSKEAEPTIKEAAAEDFTSVTFYPDLARFKMDSLNADIVGLFTRRAYDAAATSNVKVFLNDKRLPVREYCSITQTYITIQIAPLSQYDYQCMQ